MKIAPENSPGMHFAGYAVSDSLLGGVAAIYNNQLK
jgi:hypothetical protein